MKPNIYVMHESCPVNRENSTCKGSNAQHDGEVTPNYDADNIMDFLGIKNKDIAL